MKIVLACLVMCYGLAMETRPAEACRLMGAGTISCGKWTTDRRDPKSTLALLDASWVVGFLSGIGWVGQNGDDPLRGLDGEAVWAWIDNYCKANPLDSLDTAAVRFYFAHPH